MSSTRWTLVPGAVAAGIVVVGVAIAAAAYFGVEGVIAGSSSSSGPSLEFVPEGATLVGYVDVQALASSPIADTWRDTVREQDPFDGLEEIEDSTSIDLLTDVESLTLAVAPSTGNERWGVVLQGVFDRARLLAKLAEGKGPVETSTHSGTEVHSIRNGTQSMAMAQPDDSVLLFGDSAYVRDMLDAGAGRKPSATAVLSRWGYGGFEEDTFWFAGAPRFLDGMMGRDKDAAALRSFAITGRFENDLVLRARGEAIDASKAGELADVVRGLVAFGRLQQDNAELGKILESISVEIVDQEIEVNLLVPYESIRELLNRKAGARSAH